MSPYERYGLFIAGEWRPPFEGRTFGVTDPATGDLIGHAPQTGRADTVAAIDTAEAAFLSWRRTDPWRRAAVLRRIAGRMRAASAELASWITRETGKPLKQSIGEVATAADYFDWFADETRRICGDVIAVGDPGISMTVTRESVGIALALTSWNFPVNLPARKIAAALAAGCSVICRPSEESPGAAMALFATLIDEDLPPGTVNLLTGLHGPIVDTVMADARVRKVSFTGSGVVGRSLMAAGARTMKRMSLELGGHAAAIVFDDADVERSASDLATFKFRNAGQICISPSRFFVHERVAQHFTDEVCRHAAALVVGNGFADSTDMGPLINRKRLKAVEALVADALAGGAVLRWGGRRCTTPARGFFFEPTVLDAVPDSARVMNEEPFGPLLPIQTFRDDDEVVDRVNRLDYGLANYLFTVSERRARTTAAALRCGMVGVNTASVAAVDAPFGGVGGSGFGSEGGRYGIDDYLVLKYTKSVMAA